MKLLFLILHLSFFCLVIHSSAQDLPKDSADLLGKLDSYAKTEREAAERRIQEKASAVAKVLESHLERETKAGNLDEGIALRREIERLNSLVPPKKSVPAKFLPVADSGHLKIKVEIDSYSELKLRGARIWFDHTRGSGALPGRHSGELPTEVDGKEWTPKWDGRVSDQYELDQAIPTDGLTLTEFRIKKLEGRGSVEVVDQPTEENDFTATFGLRDGGNGAAWLEFRLSW